MPFAFATPIYLLALLPWFALTLWILRAARPSTIVPFVRLWTDGDAPQAQPNSRLNRPPWSIVFVLLALLLAILAAAGPTILLVASSRPVCIILDCGLASAGRNEAEWNAFANRAEREIVAALGARKSFRVIPIPSESSRAISSDHLADAIRAAPPTALDTSELLPQAITERLAQNNEDIVVLTNQSVAQFASRVQSIRIRERELHNNIAITRLGVSDVPKPAVMIHLRNNSPTTRPLPLTISVDGKLAVQTTIGSPAPGNEADAFVDLPKSGNTIRVAIDANDEVAVDDVAFAARDTSGPTLEPRTPLPPEVRRFIDTYSKVRPAIGASNVGIGIVDASLDSSFADSPLPLVAIASDRLESVAADASPTVVDHPITRHVGNWAGDLADARFAAAAPKDFQPLITIGGKTAVAVRDEQARQVWIGFQSESFARKADFVIFWADLIDWLGGDSAAHAWTSHPVRQLGDDWKRDAVLSGPPPTADPTAGIFFDAAGRRIALSVTDLPDKAVGVPTALNEPQSMKIRRPERSIAPAVCMVAMGCLLVASICWSRNFRSSKRTQG